MYFTCEIHNKKFPSIQALREHDREFHSKDMQIKKSAKLKKLKDAAISSISNKSATSSRNVVQIENVDNVKPIIILTINQVNEESDPLLQCHICGYLVTSSTDLNYHFQTHQTKNTLSLCSIKKEPIKLEQNSEKYNPISDDDDVEVTAVISRTKEVCPFICRFCNRRFKSQEFLKSHMKSEHCDDPDFRVSDIDDDELIDTDSESSISNQDDGSDSEFVPSDDDADKEFKNDLTDDNTSITSQASSSNTKRGQFDGKSKWNSRNNPHFKYENEKDSICYNPYLPEGIITCYFCGYTPQQHLIPKFDHHMIKHTLEKPFRCKVCNKHFSNEKDVLKHEKSHTSRDISDRIYKCNQCSSKFSDSRVLMRHKLTHSSRQNHGCNECGRKYKRLGDLRRHFVSAHQKGDVFKCKICLRDCRRKDLFLLHMRTCHPGVKIKIPPPPKVSWSEKMKPKRRLSKMHPKSQNYSRLDAELNTLT